MSEHFVIRTAIATSEFTRSDERQSHDQSSRNSSEPSSTRATTTYTDIPQSAILERGWTKALIAKFLGETDRRLPNPHYSQRGAPMRPYQLDLVVAVEATQAFQAARQQSERRRAAGRGAAERRRQETRDWVQSLPITTPVMSWDELVMRACPSYNGHQYLRPGRDEWTSATSTSDREFLERVAVNYLRHQASRYDEFLNHAQRRIGVHEARLEIKRRVLQAIAISYPELTAECDRQAQRAETNYRDVAMPGRPGSAGRSLAG